MIAKNRKAALGFIFLTVLIDVIGLGIIAPVIPDLIKQLTGKGLSRAAELNGLLTLAYALMQFVCAPLMGNLSDRYGRRPVLLFSLLGFGFDYLFQGFAPTLGWLFVGRTIAGMTGASFTTATAYIADVSEPGKRAQNFGLVGAAFGLGFIIGPVLGGHLSVYGTRVPFFAAAALSLLNCIYGYFVLPESLPVERRRKFEWTRANPVGSLKQFKKYPSLYGLFAAMTLIYLSAHAILSTWLYYNMKKFNWDAQWGGYSLGFIGIMIALVQGLLIRVIIPKLGQERSVYVGLSLYSIAFILFAFATQGWEMFLFMVPYALGGIAGPALQGIISSHVPANEQGELQGGLTSLMSCCAIIGPLIMTGLFAYFTGKDAPFIFPGAPFIVGALLTMTSAVIAYKNYRKNKLLQEPTKDLQLNPVTNQ
jgi:DHA1 family tetracycline resistance protein-like MFS transporter